MNNVVHWSCRGSKWKMTGDAKKSARSKQNIRRVLERLNLPWLDFNKLLAWISLGPLQRSAVIMHLVDSYESFQLFIIELCTTH